MGIMSSSSTVRVHLETAMRAETVVGFVKSAAVSAAHIETAVSQTL